jgi:hypothetical protein
VPAPTSDSLFSHLLWLTPVRVNGQSDLLTEYLILTLVSRLLTIPV